MTEHRGYASWGIRVAAGVIDVLLVLAVALLLRLLEIPIRSAWLPDSAELGRTLGAAEYIGDTKQKLRTLGAVNGVLLALTVIANTVVLQGITGRSLGKWILRVRLAAADSGSPVGMGRVLVRQVAHVVDSLPCFLGYLWPIWDPRRQTFADKLTGTIVVPVEQSRQGSAEPAPASRSDYRHAAIVPRSNPETEARTERADPDRSPRTALPAAGPGVSVHQYVESHGPLPESAVRALGTRLARLLADEHASGRVHGHLAPDTVPIAPGEPLPTTTSVLGGYAAPEVAVGMPVTPAGDVFALGTVLVYAVTGSGPFGDGTAELLLQRTVAAEPDLTWVPSALGEPLRRCLAKDPAQRPRAMELVGLLDLGSTSDAIETPTATAQSENPLSASHTGDPSRRNAWMITAAVAAVLLLVAGATSMAFVLGGNDTPGDASPLLSVDTVLYSIYSTPDTAMPVVTGIAVDRHGNLFTAALDAATEAPAPHRHIGNLDSVAVDDDGTVYVDKTIDLWKLRPDSPALAGPTGTHLAAGPYSSDGANFTEVALRAMYDFVPTAVLSQVPPGCRITARSNTVYKACPGAVFELPSAPDYHTRAARLPFAIDENQVPGGIAVDNTGAVYLTVTERDGSGRKARVLKLAPGANQPAELPFQGLGEIGGGIAVDDTGTVHVVDPGNRRILALAPGSATATTEATFPYVGSSRTPTPTALAVDHSGAVFVAVSDQITKSATIHKLTAPVPR